MAKDRTGHLFSFAKAESLRSQHFLPTAAYGLAFKGCGPSAWNDLTLELYSFLMAHPSKFYIFLKSFFGRDWAGSTSK